MIATRMFVAASMATAMFAASALAQGPSRNERIQFSRGANSSSIRATIRGSESVDYIIGARQGQTLTVSMRTTNRSAYFNVLPPRGDTGIFNGSLNGSRYRGELPQGGDYRIRVYLMRNAARRNEQASFTLDVAVTGLPSRPGAPGGPGGNGPGPIISTGNMPAFCRGEAAGRFKTRPQYVQVGRIERAREGGSIIQGTADLGNAGNRRFRCRFDARNRFVDIMAITRDEP